MFQWLLQQIKNWWTREERLEEQLNQLLENERKQTMTAQEALAQVRATHGAVDSLILHQNLQYQRLLEAIGNQMTPEIQEAIDLVFNESKAQAEQVRQQLKAALPDPDLGIWTTKLIANGIQLIH